jgi:hypothetical protein
MPSSFSMQTEHTESEPETPTNLEPQTSNLKPPHRRCRNGKIARLPRAIREAVNVMLLDGFLYRDIAAKLEEAGYPDSLSPLGGEGQGEGSPPTAHAHSHLIPPNPAQ